MSATPCFSRLARISARISIVVALAFLAGGAAFAQEADLRVDKADTVDPLAPGANQTYNILVRNLGPDDAANAQWSDTLPAELTFVSIGSLPPGWTCGTTPPVGTSGLVQCTAATLAASAVDAFTLTVQLDPGAPSGSTVLNTASVSSTTFDPDEENNASTASTLVAGGALSITKSASPEPVPAGDAITYTLTVANADANVTVTDILPAGTTFSSLSAPGGWSCTEPDVGTNGTVNCGAAAPPPGVAVFSIVVLTDGGLTAGTVISNTASVSADVGTDEGSADSTIGPPLSVDPTLTKTASAPSVTAGDGITYTITYTQPAASPSVSLDDTLPANTTFTSLLAPAGFTCTTPAPNTAGTVSCNAAALAAGSYVFTLNVATSFDTPPGTITNTANSTTDIEGEPRPLSASVVTNVTAASTFTARKTVTGSFSLGGGVTYTVVLSNLGPVAQNDNSGDEFTDVLPASLTLTGASASTGVAVANLGTNTVTWNGAIPASGSVTITIQAVVEIANGTVSNQGQTSFDRNNNGINETSGVTDDPAVAGTGDPTVFEAGTAVAAIPTLGEWGLLGLAGMLAAAGARRLRRG